MFDLTLSFDNGPEPDVTPAVLDVLARHGLKTTFFVIGEKLEDPERKRVAERAHGEGHWIGNHTYTHSVPLGRMRGSDVAEREVGRTQQALGSLSHPQRWFRPYGGGGNLSDGLLQTQVVRHLVSGGYSCVLWNAIPHDWDDPEGWVERALSLCASQPWTLMVLHDLPTGAMKHLAHFLDRAKEAGARFHQEFPPACVLIRSGEIVQSVDSYVSNIEESNL